MTSTSDSLGSSEQNADDQKKRLEHYATVLREYAKWSLLRGYQFSKFAESQREQLVRRFFTAGAQAHLTQRDLVLLLYRDILRESSSVDPAD